VSATDPRRVPIIACVVLCLLTFHASSAALASTNGLHGTREPHFERLPGSAELRDPRIGISRATLPGFSGSRHTAVWSATTDTHSAVSRVTLRILTLSATTRSGASSSIARERYWLGTWGSGLNRYDPVTEQFIRYRYDPADPSSLSDDHVRSLSEDRKGNLWVGTTNGMNELDRRTGQFHRYLYEPQTGGFRRPGCAYCHP